MEIKYDEKQLLDKLVLILESEDANNTLTFETALEQYIRSKENILSPSTIRGYRILQRNAYDYINNLTLSEINELVLQSGLITMQSNTHPKR